MAIYYTFGGMDERPLPDAPQAKSFDDLRKLNTPRDASCVLKVQTQLQCGVSSANPGAVFRAG